MDGRVDLKKALKDVLRLAKQGQEVLEKTSFVFHSYKIKEDAVVREYVEHITAMSRKIVTEFDLKGNEARTFIISYETVKALTVAIQDFLEKIDKKSQNHKMVVV